MALVLVTAPSEEPIELSEAKNHLRIDGTDEDTLISGLIATAREHAEHFTRRAFITQTWELWLDAWPDGECITLPLPPLQSVAHVKYYGIDDTEYTFDSANYFVDTNNEPGRVVLGYSKSWPTLTLRPANGIVVRYVCGYGAASAVPQAIKQAMLLHIGAMFENREAVVSGSVNVLPMAYGALLWPYRVFNF